MIVRYDWITLKCPYCSKKTKYTNILSTDVTTNHNLHLETCDLRPIKENQPSK